jgi:tetratricopeptide (TPR) repeat protein
LVTTNISKAPIFRSFSFCQKVLWELDFSAFRDGMKNGRNEDGKNECHNFAANVKRFLKIQKLTFPDNPSGLAYAYYDFGVCNYYLGINKQSQKEDDQAICFLKSVEDWLKKALTINLKMRGAVALDTISNYEFLGNTYAALGKVDNANENYCIAISMMEQLVGLNDNRLITLKNKIKQF